MRRTPPGRGIPLALCAAAVLTLLSACTRYPARAADGAAWDREWTMHGDVLGVEAPEDFTLLQNYAVLTMDGLSFSVWGYGTAVPDAEGEEEYEAQVFLLLKECASAEEAQNAVADWTARLTDLWTVSEVREEEHNGQSYTVRACEGGETEDGLPRREQAAFTCYGSYAVSAEMEYRASFSGDAGAALSAFLDGCHYSAATDGHT